MKQSYDPKTSAAVITMDVLWLKQSMPSVWLNQSDDNYLNYECAVYCGCAAQYQTINQISYKF
jgi:hypothetical protein